MVPTGSLHLCCDSPIDAATAASAVIMFNVSCSRFSSCTSGSHFMCVLLFCFVYRLGEEFVCGLRSESEVIFAIALALAFLHSRRG